MEDYFILYLNGSFYSCLRCNKHEIYKALALGFSVSPVTMYTLDELENFEDDKCF